MSKREPDPIAEGWLFIIGVIVVIGLVAWLVLS